jgi:diketogulonate reductase-like aldo/keto reductase
MTLIDTAEGYSNGRSEELIGRVIAGQRDRVFLVSKVDHMTTGDAIARACEASLARLGTEHLDLYLAHWRDRGADLSVIVTAFENLRTAGKIRAWGVSNFSVSDMEELFHIPHGDRCATNQVPYNIGDRRIENDLLPWCEQHGMPVMAYSPLGGPGASLLGDPTLARIGAARGCSAAAVALAWTIRSGNVIAIPESGLTAHVKENAVALTLTLTPQELQTLDAAYPPPTRCRSQQPMSALGQKQTSDVVHGMSALPPKADIRLRGRDVRFVPKADIVLRSKCASYSATRPGQSIINR